MPKPFDLLAQLGRFGEERDLSLRDPATLAAFVEHAREALDGALEDPRLLHGFRIEALFEALVVSLGDFRLLKPEDSGHVYPPHRFRIPDFRVVLKDGRQWLVEVKNVYVDDPADQRRKLLRKEELAAAQAYAEATGAELKLAVYWARWSLWTLVTPGNFVDGNGDVVLEMMSALAATEFAALGDRTIGTKPPLVLRFRMDPEKTGPIGPDGKVRCVIGKATMHCGDAEIVDPVDQQIAWLFMQHGEWPGSEGVALVDGRRLEAIEFRFEPNERLNEGFEMIGSLSRMFSRYYAAATVMDGEVVQLRAASRPDWFEPLVSDDARRSKALPLWRFVQKPSKLEAP